MIKYVTRKDITYGISAVDENGKILRTFPHIHTNKKMVTNFVKLCNLEELDVMHLGDAIEDLINQATL